MNAENFAKTGSTSNQSQSGIAVSAATISSDDPESEDEVLSTPTLGPPETPYVGMLFDSELQAKRHYNRYAHHVGFSVKIGNAKKSMRTLERYNVLFVCNKSGKEPDNDATGNTILQRSRSHTKKTECQARMRVKKIGDRWRVVSFTEEHTHPLVAKFSLKKFLRSHKKIPTEEREFITLLHTVNISAGRIMALIAEIYGGREFVPYNDKDVSNVKAKINSANRHKDVAALLSHFETLKKEDPEFFYKIQLDHMDRVISIFWVDGPAREAYKLYFDCMPFDTTYLTNMYNMPCAPFIGINRYGQTIQFGCAFLRDEKCASFEWLFESFLEAMGGIAPLNMITDQDIAMGAAISKVFPNTCHRNCRWHIMQKAQQKLGNFMARREELRLEFNEIIDYSLTIEEFEQRWAQMIDRHQVAENENLRDLYDIRSSFVPAYYRNNFFPFLQTTSRSEGFNAVMKKYQSPQNSLMNFFMQYKKIQEKIDSVEDGNEFEIHDKVPKMWSNLPVEHQALTIYTRPIYMIFRAELRRTTAYRVRRIAEHVYELELRTGCAIYEYGKRMYRVTATPQDGQYECECCKMTRDGVLCCHVLAVMANLGVDEIPEQYILPRWSRMEENYLEPPAPTQKPQNRKVSPKEMRLIRYGNLCSDFAKIAKEACVSDKAKAIASSHMAALLSDLQELKISGSKKRKRAEEPQTADPTSDPQTVGITSQPQNADPTSDPQADGQQGATQAVKNPRNCKPKGRPAQKRKKSGLELQPAKTTKCSLCGSDGHNSQTCPGRFGTVPPMDLPKILR